jgi:hypothetical protein
VEFFPKNLEEPPNKQWNYKQLPGNKIFGAESFAALNALAVKPMEIERNNGKHYIGSALKVIPCVSILFNNWLGKYQIALLWYFCARKIIRVLKESGKE